MFSGIKRAVFPIADEEHDSSPGYEPVITILLLITILSAWPGGVDAHRGGPADHEKQVLAVFPEHFPPVYDITENGLPSGFGIDVMEAVAREAHLTIRYSGVSNWPQALSSLATGEADLIPNVGITPPRQDSFRFSIPYGSVPIAVFTHRDTGGIDSVEDLRSRRVGVVRMNEGERIMEQKDGIILMRFDSLNELFVALIDRSVDAAVYPAPIFSNLAQRFNSNELIRQLDQPVTVVKRGVAVHERNAHLLDKINPALQTLQLTGEMQRIYDRWYPPPPPFWNAKRVAMISIILIFTGTAMLLYTRVRVLNKMNKLLVESNYYSNAILDTSSECILTVNSAGDILSINSACENILGRTESDIVNNNLSTMLDGVDVAELLSGRSNNNSSAIKYHTHESCNVINADNEKNPVKLSLSPMLADGKKSFVITLHDERPAIRAEQRAEYLTYHDPMTGMLNLRGVRNILASSFHQQPPVPVCCMCTGLHRLKHINGLYGRQAGNQLLLLFANTIREIMELQNIHDYHIARISGERFFITFPAPVQDEAERVANEIKKALSRIEMPVEDVSEMLIIDASVGVTFYPDHASDVDELIYYTEIALQHAEQSNSDLAYVLTDRDKSEESEYERSLHRIRSAMNHDRFMLYFQPIKNLKTGKILEFEVLLRMYEPDGTIIMPADIIPVAERFGLITRIDYRVLELTLTYLAALQDKHSDIKLAVNLSASHFGDQNLYGWFREILEITSELGRNLIFEITETSALQHFAHARDFMYDLKSQGVDFSLDDFGVGFTSFAQLRSLPVDYVKIDGVFVKEIMKNKEDQAIVTALTKVAHSLGKKVVAEFIEDEATYNFLRKIGVDYGQGYYIGRPSPELPLATRDDPPASDHATLYVL